MYKAIFLIALLYAANGLQIHTNNDVNADYQGLARYIHTSEIHVDAEYIGTNVVLSYHHFSFPSTYGGFSMEAYMAADPTAKTSVTPTDVSIDLTRITNDRYGFGVSAKYPMSYVLNNQHGCYQYSTMNSYFVKRCKVDIHYIPDNYGGTAKVYGNQIYVWIPRNGTGVYDMNAEVDIVEGCNCNITTDIPYVATLYKENCKDLVTDDDEFVYGDVVCLCLEGRNQIAKNYYLNPTSITVNFNDANGNAKRQALSAMSKVYSNDGSTTKITGIIYAKVTLLAVGELTFTMVTRLEETARRLLTDTNADSTKITAKGNKSVFSQKVKVDDPEVQVGFSATTFVSALTFIAMLLLAL